MTVKVVTDAPGRPGVLLVGHGTRSELGQCQFLALAAKVRQRLNRLLEPAFLELAEPTIDQAVQRLVNQGIDQLIVAPLLLFAAGHAKEDIPTAVAQSLSRIGAANLRLRQTEPYGCHPLIVELAYGRLQAAVHGRRFVPPERTLLLAVGRGSSDDVATAEMQTFAELLSERAALKNLRVAFLAKAKPAMSEALSQVAPSRFERVIVQPHLLFHGELVQRLRQQVNDFAAMRPDQEWLVAELLANPLGEGKPQEDLLTAATVELIELVLLESAVSQPF